MVATRDRRRQERIGYDMPIEYALSVLEFGNLQNLLKGMGIDMSRDGMGFIADCRLESGNAIDIRKSDGTVFTGMVKWVAEMDGKFRVGVLFYK